MTSVAYVEEQLRHVVETRANELARETGCIVRQRKLDGATLLQTLLFGFQQHPHASLEQLASTAQIRGVSVTDTAIDKRFNQECARFLHAVLQEMSSVVVQAAQAVPLKLLKRFSAVICEDSSTITLPDELVDLFCEGGGRKPRPTSEIDGALEQGGLLRGDAGSHHRLEDQRGRAIAEIVDQHVLEARRVLIEQGLHIGLRHLRQLRIAEAYQMQMSAMLIARVGIARFAKGRNRLVALAELRADFAEREPGRGEIRCEFDRLLDEIGGSWQITLELEVARELEAAVGHQIAGGQE